MGLFSGTNSRNIAHERIQVLGGALEQAEFNASAALGRSVPISRPKRGSFCRSLFRVCRREMAIDPLKSPVK